MRRGCGRGTGAPRRFLLRASWGGGAAARDRPWGALSGVWDEPLGRLLVVLVVVPRRLRPRGAAGRRAAAAEEARAGSGGGAALSGPPRGTGGSSPPGTAGERPGGSCFENVLLRCRFFQRVGGTCCFGFPGCKIFHAFRFVAGFPWMRSVWGCACCAFARVKASASSLLHLLTPCFCFSPGKTYS